MKINMITRMLSRKFIYNFITPKLCHVNFNPIKNCSIESSYKILKVNRNITFLTQQLVLGITFHAEERMKQRGITYKMLSTSIKNANIRHESPQKKWDKLGRMVFTCDNMVVVTNFEQNRIVTVYWQIENWEYMNKNQKITAQEKSRDHWIVNNF